jgi:hypothetical protein
VNFGHAVRLGCQIFTALSELQSNKGYKIANNVSKKYINSEFCHKSLDTRAPLTPNEIYIAPVITGTSYSDI